VREPCRGRQRRRRADPRMIGNRRGDVVERIHGVDVADPYRWLEDATNPDVRAWMDAQDERARAYLAPLPRRAALVERFRELFYVDWLSAPRKHGDRYFWARRSGKEEKAVLCWKDGVDGVERVLLDPNALSPDGSVSLGTWGVSHTGRYLAYTLKRNNSDSAVLRVRDVATGADLAHDVIADAKYASPEWLPDDSGFYYTWLPDDRSIPPAALPGHAEIRFHRIGSDPALDPVVHQALGDPTRFLSVGVSWDGRWLFVAVQRGWTATDLYFRDLHGSAEGFRELIAGSPNNYDVLAWKDRFYIHTNEGAPRFRLLCADPRRPARAAWSEIVPEQEGTLEGVQVIGDRLVTRSLRRARSEVAVRTLDGALVREIELPGIGSVSAIVGNPDEDEVYYSFSAFTEPPAIFRTSVQSPTSALWWRAKIAADTASLVCEQIFCRSRDGTEIPMFVVHRKDMPLDGARPALLTGYGGFNVSLTPFFRSTAVVWAEQGGVFVVANLRGGGEFGEDWHRAGMLEQKQNVFDDFVAVAESLIARGFTRPDRLAISGGSNGGLLVGAAMTQRPELFGAVVCAVPLLDMVRYHRFGSGTTWTDEYGSAEDPQQLRALHAYSPYHRVRAGVAYPALLLLSADSDDRVDPMHARKFAAALQDANPAGRPVLLRVERNAGHTGADQVRLEVERQADQFAFLLDSLAAPVEKP